MSKLKTVNDLYKYSKNANIPLLSNYNAIFWQEYTNNYARYDKLFNRTYLTFKYFMQDGTETIEELTNDFTEAVYEHLLINNKKYEELYRIYILQDSEYSIVENYSVTETMDKDTTNNNTNTYGDRLDNTTSTQGEQTSNSTSKVSPYDSENFYNDGSASDTIGSRTDTVGFTKGSQTDTLDNTGTEKYTLTKKGNIGVQTATDMIDKHDTYWNKYRFYTAIFENISKDLLLV